MIRSLYDDVVFFVTAAGQISLRGYTTYIINQFRNLIYICIHIYGQFFFYWTLDTWKFHQNLLVLFCKNIGIVYVCIDTDIYQRSYFGNIELHSECNMQKPSRREWLNIPSSYNARTSTNVLRLSIYNIYCNVRIKDVFRIALNFNSFAWKL